MKASEVMTSPVVSVTPGTSVRQVMQLMHQHKIGGIPVVDSSGKLVGIVTERDFLRPAENTHRRPRWSEVVIWPRTLLDKYADRHAKTVQEFMTADLVTVTEDTPVEEVARLMEKHRIKRILVTRDGRLVGIITRVDLIEALERMSRELGALATNGAAIRRRVAELERRMLLCR